MAPATTTSTAAPGTTTSTAAPVTTAKTPKTTPSACNYWSEWINEDDPKNGDHEFKSADQLRQLGFCLSGTIKDIECRDVLKDRLYSQTSNQGVVCNLEQGLSCNPSKQGKGGRCLDYKIKYYCHCEEERTTTSTAAPVTTTSTTAPVTTIASIIVPKTTTLAKPTTTPAKPTTTPAKPTTPLNPATTTIIIWPTTTEYSYVCDETDMISLLADKNKIGDSAFIATSSINSRLGPQNARLHSGHSWVAGKNNLEQYIQVDLGTRQRIFAIDLTGNPVDNEYVTSLYVLFSTDNKRFSYVVDKNGNFHLFLFFNIKKSIILLSIMIVLSR